jgi:hypothetical protein
MVLLTDTFLAVAGFMVILFVRLLQRPVLRTGAEAQRAGNEVRLRPFQIAGGALNPEEVRHQLQTVQFPFLFSVTDN